MAFTYDGALPYVVNYRQWKHILMDEIPYCFTAQRTTADVYILMMFMLEDSYCLSSFP